MEKKAKLETGPVHVTDSDFDQHIKDNPVALIDFWASWCGPCRALAPTIEQLAREYTGKVFVGKLDVDENPGKAESFNVFSIPTMVILKDGCEVDRLVGCVPKEEIETILKKHIAK